MTDFIVRLPTVPDQQVLRQAIEHNGTAYQTDIVIEEMSELTKALLKHRRAVQKDKQAEKCYTLQQIYEEMADVVIGMTQLLMIYDCKRKVREIIQEKVDRLSDDFDR